MSKFLTAVKAEQLGVDRFKLLESLAYQSDLLKIIVLVPKGFITDFESVPRWLPVVYAMLQGEAHAPGVIHDYLYQTHKAGDVGINRKMADDVLYEAAGARGPGITSVSWYKRWMLWSGVRVGGAGAYESGPRRLKILWDRRKSSRPSDTLFT